MKKNFSIRAYLILSHSLLLIFSLGVIGIVWSGNEYHVITQELQRLMRERVTLLANFIGHEISEHDEINLDESKFLELNYKENMLAVYIDSSGKLHTLIPATVNSKDAELFMDLSSKYAATNNSYTMLIRSSTDTTSIYASSPVFNDKMQYVGIVCLLTPTSFACGGFWRGQS